MYIEGRLQTRKYTGQDGQERQIVEVVAQEMQLLDPRQGGQGGGNYGDSESGGSNNRSNNRPAPQRSTGGNGGGAGSTQSSGYEDTDMDVDDIPF